MQLLEDIINELVEPEKNLASPLLKTKVLASRIRNENLTMWLTKELDGYGPDDIIPEYRVTDARVTMSYTNGRVQLNGQPVPTQGMHENAKQFLTKFDLRQTVSTLQSYALTADGNVLSAPVSAELVHYVQEYITSMGDNPFFEVISISKVFSPHAAIEILAIIRNRLLDFMLKIEEEFGTQVTIESLRGKNDKINTIMNHYITNTGDGNIINTGNKAKIDAAMSITKGDWQKLEKELVKSGVNTDDVAALQEVINTESVNPAINRFGPEVNNWIQKMIGKALDGSWQIGVGTAGGLLTELIKAYYGLGN